MNSYEIISKTKCGVELNNEEINWLVNGYVKGLIPDYQMSAWLMAVCINSLTERETAALTYAMRDSGSIVDLSAIDGITVDKHSTGGVGDKTSLIIAPIVAACGVFVPKMSGRGLGHTGGTIDKLESIPGLSTNISHEKFIDVVNRAGFSIVSQSGRIVPADKKMYALRDATATVDSIPLICSSIMSKKLAMGADCIILDVKTGKGAFMKTSEEAVQLAEKMIKTGSDAGKKCKALITDMNEPLGTSIGNSVEVIEAIEILKGNEKGRLYELCIELSANMLESAGRGDLTVCRKLAEKSINDGSAVRKLEIMVELQGGNPRVIYDYTLFPWSINSFDVISERSGYIESINSETIGLAVLRLGAGRKTKESSIDLSAGIKLYKTAGDYVEKGEKICVLYSSQDISDEEKSVIGMAFSVTENKFEKKSAIFKVLS